MPRMHYVYTRSGLAPAIIPDPPPPNPVRVLYYTPKPAWMDHVPGPRLRFGNRLAFEAYLRREKEAGRRA